MSSMETMIYKLSDVALKICDGVHNTVIDTPDGECYLLSAKNIKQGVINYDSGDRKIDLLTRNKLNKRTKLCKDDVVITTIGTIGEGAVVGEDCNKYEFQRSVGIIKPNINFVLPYYLYYLLTSRSYNYYFHVLATGAAQPCIFLKTLNNLKVELPVLSVQKKIVSILNNYDQLIKNNNKRIKILEYMAESLYKEWFVRFRFPGHETAEFENGIPKGWEIKQLQDFGKIKTGKTPSTENKEYYGEDFLFVKTPDMHSNVIIIDSNEKLSVLGDKSQKNCLIPPNSIMVSCIGTGGVSAINYYPAHTNQQINSIILNQMNQLEWLYFQVKSMKEIIIMFGNTGSTMTNLSKGKFEKLKLLKPTDYLIESFSNILKPILNLEAKYLLINQNLIKQRDLLLPRLMSGKLEIKTNEK